jgi:hypothetical protein
MEEKEEMTTVISKITGEKIEVPKKVIKDVRSFLTFSPIEEHLSVHGKPIERQLYQEYINKLWDLALENFEVKEWKGMEKKLREVL